jgi:UDP-N-acetylglucosamine 2-epimerase
MLNGRISNWLTSSLICLATNRKGVITDSGRVTEETTILSVPYLILRDNTERPVTITIGINQLVGTTPSKLPPALSKRVMKQWRQAPSICRETERQWSSVWLI